jgi:hypothetical protein
MTLRDDLLKKIRKWLSFLCSEVELSNSLNLQDINVHAENFFRDFLNQIYGYDLKNANYVKINTAAIDLVDDVQQLAIQVTSDTSSTKVHETISKFNKGLLFEKYSRLVILVITAKKEFPKVQFDNIGNTLFDKQNDIKDISDLLNDINNFEIDKIELIADFIEKEVALKAPPHKRQKEANEVESIMRLIEYLSANSVIEDISEKEPDPEGKVYRRFADYADYLTGRYKELAYLYIQPLKIAETEIGLDKVKVKKIQLYLKGKSNGYLTEKGGNPQEAIESMVAFFSLKLTESNFDFDEIAAEFYLIDELIKCNVFPNP